MRFLWWFICYNEDILVGTKEVVGTRQLQRALGIQALDRCLTPHYIFKVLNIL